MYVFLPKKYVFGLFQTPTHTHSHTHHTHTHHTQDMRTLRFAHKQETHGRRLMYERLQHVAFPISDGKNVFAFNFTEEFSENGWLVYNAEAELKRLVRYKNEISV